MKMIRVANAREQQSRLTASEEDFESIGAILSKSVQWFIFGNECENVASQCDRFSITSSRPRRRLFESRAQHDLNIQWFEGGNEPLAQRLFVVDEHE
jgi:hypothetical protein